jgi:hypothetical protein
MRHEEIRIKGIDLENQWDCDNRTAAEVAGLDSIDPDALYEISWPDHVLTPRYNGDCEIRLVAEPTSVIRRGDGTLLCDKHYAEQYPGVPEPTYGWELGVCSMCHLRGRKG